MKIVTILGARPQFIKASVLSQKLKKIAHEVIIHTGQHFDKNMSDIFFKDLNIPKPKYFLGINSLPHGAMTGRMLEQIEQILIMEKPNLVLVYGDTNSTLAGALAASKLNIPIAHVEAGLRTGKMKQPEEANRRLTDHISYWNFAPTIEAERNLSKERLGWTVYNFGDIMYDGILRDLEKIKESDIISIDDMFRGDYILVTLHRPQNVDDHDRLIRTLTELENCGKEVYFPIHPRTRKLLGKKFLDILNIHILEPLDRLSFVKYLNDCSMVVTDSGGVQKEAYMLKKPCLTISDSTAWTETLEENWNILSKPHEIGDNIMKSLKKKRVHHNVHHYGDGRAAIKICNVLFNHFNT